METKKEKARFGHLRCVVGVIILLYVALYVALYLLFFKVLLLQNDPVIWGEDCRRNLLWLVTLPARNLLFGIGVLALTGALIFLASRKVVVFVFIAASLLFAANLVVAFLFFSHSGLLF